jgi:hypothetical protein
MLRSDMSVDENETEPTSVSYDIRTSEQLPESGGCGVCRFAALTSAMAAREGFCAVRDWDSVGRTALGPRPGN